MDETQEIILLNFVRPKGMGNGVVKTIYMLDSHSSFCFGCSVKTNQHLSTFCVSIAVVRYWG